MDTAVPLIDAIEGDDSRFGGGTLSASSAVSPLLGRPWQVCLPLVSREGELDSRYHRRKKNEADCYFFLSPPSFYSIAFAIIVISFIPTLLFNLHFFFSFIFSSSSLFAALTRARATAFPDTHFFSHTCVVFFFLCVLHVDINSFFLLLLVHVPHRRLLCWKRKYGEKERSKYVWFSSILPFTCVFLCICVLFFCVFPFLSFRCRSIHLLQCSSGFKVSVFSPHHSLIYENDSSTETSLRTPNADRKNSVRHNNR